MCVTVVAGSLGVSRICALGAVSQQSQSCREPLNPRSVASQESEVANEEEGADDSEGGPQCPLAG